MRLRFLAAFLAALPSASLGLCLTKNALPVSSPLEILKQDWILHSDGSNVFIHEFRLYDYNADGKLDIVLVKRDESYDGSPIYSVKYYRGEAEGFCGVVVAPSLTALDENFVLNIIGGSKGFPVFSMQYISLDRNADSTREIRETFSYNSDTQTYIRAD